MKIINGTFTLPVYNEARGIKGTTIQIIHGEKEKGQFTYLTIEGELDEKPAYLFWRFRGSAEEMLEEFRKSPVGRTIESTTPSWVGRTKNGFESILLTPNTKVFGVGDFCSSGEDKYGVMQLETTADIKWSEKTSDIGKWI